MHSNGATSAFSTATMMISLPFSNVSQQQQQSLTQSQQMNDSYPPVCSNGSLTESAFLTFPESMGVSANTGYLNGQQQSYDQVLGVWTSTTDMIKMEPCTFAISPASETSVFTPIAGPSSSVHFFNGGEKELKLQHGHQQRCASAIEFHNLVPEASEISNVGEHQLGQKKQKKKAQKQKHRRFSAMDTAELAIVTENMGEGTLK